MITQNFSQHVQDSSAKLMDILVSVTDMPEPIKSAVNNLVLLSLDNAYKAGIGDEMFRVKT